MLGAKFVQASGKMNNLDQLMIYDLERLYDSIIEQFLDSHEALDVEKHFIFANYRQVPTRWKVTDFTELLEEYPRLAEDPGLLEVIGKEQSVTKKGIQKDVFYISLTLIADYLQWSYRQWPLRRLECSQEAALQPNRDALRAPVISGNSGKPLSARRDVIDSILEHCGSTFEEFWKTDLDTVIEELILSGALERTAGVNRTSAQNDLDLDYSDGSGSEVDTHLE